MTAAQQEEAAAQSEKLRAEADWMPYAQARQDMYSQTLQNEGQKISNQTARQQLAMLPLEKKAMQLDNMLKKGQITEQQYTNLAAEYKLNQAGVSTGKPSTPAGPGKKWGKVNGKWVKVPA